MKINPDSQSLYKAFKNRHGEEIAQIHSEMDSIISMYPIKHLPINMVLYHGTSSKCAKIIGQEGFKLTERGRNNRTARGRGELGKAIYFTTTEHVANLFGPKIIKATVSIESPANVSPAKWENVLAKIKATVANDYPPNKNKVNTVRFKRKFAKVSTHVIEEYLTKNNIDSLFCNDFVATHNRNMAFLKQKQWAIFVPSPKNIKIETIQQKTTSYCILRVKLRLKQLKSLIKLFIKP